MKTPRQLTQEIEARLAAEDSYEHAWQSGLQRQLEGMDAEVARLHAPHEASLEPNRTPRY